MILPAAFTAAAWWSEGRSELAIGLCVAFAVGAFRVAGAYALLLGLAAVLWG